MRVWFASLWPVLIAAVPGVLCPLSAVEENRDAPFLDPIEVEATRSPRPLMEVPAALTSVEKEQIQRARLQLTLDESMSGVPGVFILNPYNFAQDTRIAIRGFGARSDFGIRGIQLVVDGIPATLPDGQGSVDAIDLGSAESIEVLRGPAGALYGAAAGGVIRIETQEPTRTPEVEVRYTIGSYGLRQLQTKTSGSSRRWGGLLSGSWLGLDGYRDHSRTESFKLNGKATHTWADGSRLNGIINVVNIPTQDDPGGLTIEEVRADRRQARERNLRFDAGESVSQQKAGLSYSRPLAEQQVLEIGSFFTHRDFANRLPFEEGGQVTFKRNFGGGYLFHRLDGSQWHLLSGVEVGHQDDARRNYRNLNGSRGAKVLDQKENVTSTGVFAASNIRFHESINLSGALRFDRVEFDVEDEFLADGNDSGKITFEQWSPMVGLIWEFQGGSSLYANLATAFETPTSTELDNPLGGGFNQELEAQTATSYEIGLKSRTRVAGLPLRFEAALFHVDINNALVPFEKPSQPEREFYRNAGESQHRGLESFARMRPWDNFEITASYTWSDFTYVSFRKGSAELDGNRIPGIPEHLAHLKARYTSPHGFFAGWESRYVGELFADDANRTRVESYSVTDLRLGWESRSETRSIRLFLGIENLFDERYSSNIRINAFGGRHFEPAPDRRLIGGVRARLSL